MGRKKNLLLSTKTNQSTTVQDLIPLRTIFVKTNNKIIPSVDLRNKKDKCYCILLWIGQLNLACLLSLLFLIFLTFVLLKYF